MEDGESLKQAAVREVREGDGTGSADRRRAPVLVVRDGEGRSRWCPTGSWTPSPAPTSVRPARSTRRDGSRSPTLARRSRTSGIASCSTWRAAANASVYLIRHAKAGDREAWTEDDRLRPLSKSGRRQAKGLVRTLADRPIGHIASSPALRCLDTVRPLAKQRGRRIDVREELFEGAPLDGFLGIADDARSVGTVVCAHGDLIPEAIEHYEAQERKVGADRGWKKGSVWVLEREAGLIVRATHVPPSEGEPKGAARRSLAPSGPSA